MKPKTIKPYQLESTQAYEELPEESHEYTAEQELYDEERRFEKKFNN